jgi:hypothetical protein
MDENTEVGTPTIDTPSADALAEDTALPNTENVIEAIQKARAQEKAKLYPQVEKLQEEIALLRQKESEREAKEAERKAQRAARDAELAKQKKAEEESSLELRELLAKKEQEFQAQIEQERSEREKAFALLEREREFQELQQYRQQRVEAERANIMPELVDMIAGDSKDAIEQSILRLKEKTAQIVESVQAASQQTRKEMVGARITAPASGPLDSDSSQAFTPEAIQNMSQADYAKNRSRLLGTAGSNRGQGLFGNY